MTANLRGNTRRLVLVTVLAPVLALTTGCGDDDDDATEDTEDAATVCDARADLTTSMESLADVDVVADGTDELEAVIDDVGAALDTLGEEAQDEIADEVDTVQASFDDVQSAIDDFDEQESGAAAVESVSTAMTALAQGVQALTEVLSQECDGG